MAGTQLQSAEELFRQLSHAQDDNVRVADLLAAIDVASQNPLLRQVELVVGGKSRVKDSLSQYCQKKNAQSVDAKLFQNWLDVLMKNTQKARLNVVYKAGETDLSRNFKEHLLVPRRQRGDKPLLLGKDDDEDTILKTALQVNERLKESNLSRCPTGRLPGIGTCKSESVLLKKMSEESDSEKKAKQSDIERAFQEWLSNKKAEGKSRGGEMSHNQSQDEETRRARKEEAERKFLEWKKKKDRELRKKKDTETQGGKEEPNQKQLALVDDQVAERPSQGSQAVATVKSRIDQLSESEKSRLAPYFQRISIPQHFLSAEPSTLDGSDRPKTCVAVATTPTKVSPWKRFLLWMKKDSNRTRLRQSLQSSSSSSPPNPSGVSQALFTKVFLHCGCKVSPLESNRIYSRLVSMWRKTISSDTEPSEIEPSSSDIIHVLDSMDIQALLESLEEKHQHQQQQQQQQQQPQQQRQMKPNLRVSTAPQKQRPRKGKKTQRNRQAHNDASYPNSVKRLVTALEEGVGVVKTYVSENEEVCSTLHESKESFKEAVAIALRSTLGDSVDLIEQDVRAACSTFWKQKEGERSVRGFVAWLDAAFAGSVETSVASVQVDDILRSVREFFEMIPEPRTSSRVRKTIERLFLEHAEELSTSDKIARKAVEGTIWLELMKQEGFPQGCCKESDEGIITVENFSRYWLEKYQIYESERVKMTSPTHKRRPVSVSRRGRRNKATKAKDSSKGRSSPKKASNNDFLKELRLMHEKRLVEIFGGGGKGSPKTRTQSSPSRAERVSKEYAEIQRIKERLKSATSSITTATTEQVVHVLNVHHPSKRLVTILGAVCILLGVTPTWKQARALLKNWPPFVERIASCAYSQPSLSSEDMARLESAAQLVEVDMSEHQLKLELFLERWFTSVYELMKKKGLSEPRPLAMEQLSSEQPQVEVVADKSDKSDKQDDVTINNKVPQDSEQLEVQEEEKST